jgi:hypothetical protein
MKVFHLTQPPKMQARAWLAVVALEVLAFVRQLCVYGYSARPNRSECGMLKAFCQVLRQVLRQVLCQRSLVTNAQGMRKYSEIRFRIAEVPSCTMFLETT